MEVTAEELVEMLEDIQDFLEPEDLESEPEVKQTLNSRKVSDHHAIIPTGQVKNMDVKKLKERDRNVLYLIESRFLMAVGKSYIISIGQTLSRLSPRATPCKQLSLHTAFHGISLYC